MQKQAEHGKMLVVENGWLHCPHCRHNRRLKKIDPNEEGRGILLYCRDCKTESKVDISQGQCFESRSQ